MKAISNIQKIVPFLSSRSYSINNYFDICIVGGGPVGFGFASLLYSYPNLKTCRVLLLESEKYKPFVPPKHFSHRTVALSPNTKEILEGCGSWKIIEAHRCNAVKKMHVWEQTSHSFITFGGEAASHTSDLAYIVENDLLQHAVSSPLATSSNIEVRYEAKVVEIELQPTPGLATVTLADGSRVCASLLVGADGHRSRVRSCAGIKAVEWPYDMKAVVCVVGVEDGDGGGAWQRFTRLGPIAYLPLGRDRCSLIWSTSVAEADRLSLLDPQSFIDELNHEMLTEEHLDRLAMRLAPGTPQRPPKALLVDGPRASFPLGFMHASNYVAAHVALVGDAAHRILPLAGQGVNLGIGDAAALARAVSEGATVGEAVGSLRRLQQYETERQRYVLPVAATVQTLHHLYVSGLVPVVAARALGLRLANGFAPLKKVFLEGATTGHIDLMRSLLR